MTFHVEHAFKNSLQIFVNIANFGDRVHSVYSVANLMIYWEYRSCSFAYCEQRDHFYLVKITAPC